jgi:zinc transporter ZupT
MNSWITHFSAFELLAVFSFLPLLLAFIATSVSLVVKIEWLRKLFPLKVGLVVLSILGATYLLLEEIEHHGSTFDAWGWVLLICVAIITFLFMSRHTHHHHEIESLDAKALKAFVLGIMMHGLIDGLILGASFLKMSLLGVAAGNLIVLHEIPKVVVVALFLRSLGMSPKKTLFYATIPQVAIPLASFGVFLTAEYFTHTPHHISFALPEVLHAAIIVFLLTTMCAMAWKDVQYHYAHRKHKH